MIKVILLALSLVTASLAEAKVVLTPYYALSTKQLLKDNRATIDGMVTNFALANKADVRKFRYQEFDKALSSLHPALVWATLRYLNERSTGARKTHVMNYLKQSQALGSLNEALAEQPKAVDAIRFFEKQVPSSGLAKMSEKNFMKLIDKVIEELQGQKV